MLLTSLSPSEIKRVKISALLKAGKGIKEVATECQVSRRTVFYCKNRSEIKDKKRSGRPTKLSPKTKLKIRNQMKDVPGSSTRKCALSLNNSFDYVSRGKIISRRTVQRYVSSTDWGKTAYKIGEKPFLSKKTLKTG